MFNRRPSKEEEEKWLDVLRSIGEKLKLKFGENTIMGIYAWFRRIYNPITVKSDVRYFRVEGIFYIVLDDFQFHRVHEKVREILKEKEGLVGFKIAFLWDEKMQVYYGALEITGFKICFVTHPENLALLSECRDDIAIVILPYGNFEGWSYIALEELGRKSTTLPTILTSVKEVTRGIIFDEKVIL